jgi:hypothetical protein
LLPLWVVRDNALPFTPWAEQDRLAITSGALFRVGTSAHEKRLDAGTLLQQLDGIRDVQNSVVVYLAGPAVHQKGKVYVQPAGSTSDDPNHWVALQQVLMRIRDCPARHRLLVLDITFPIARLDALVSPGQYGTLEDDVAAAIPAELQAVEDPALLVLCSSGPGETALVSEEMGRSVFNFYLEEGLRGWSDGYGPAGRRDGQITVRELAAFCQARVDRWAKRNRNVRQVPQLYGSGPDFPLVALEHGEPSEMPPTREPSPYPEWLFKAWKERDAWRAGEKDHASARLFRGLEAQVLTAERAWRGGVKAELVQERLAASLALARRQLELQEKWPRPQPASLASALALGEPKDDALADTIREFLSRSLQQTHGLKADEAEKVRAALLADFREKALAKVSDFALAWAAFQTAANDPAPQRETLQTLDRLLRFRQPRPQFVETLLLRDLAESQVTRKPAIVRQCLRAVGLGQKALARQAIQPSLSERLDVALQRSHDGQVCFWANDYASAQEAEDLLASASRDLESLVEQLEILRRTEELRSEAGAFLPAFLGYLESHANYENTWGNAMRAARRLSDLLESPSPEMAELQDWMSRLADALASLREPLEANRVKRVMARSRDEPPDPSLYGEMEALLNSPLLDSELRKAVWTATSQLGRRLNDLTRQLDEEENETSRLTTPASEYDHQSAVNEERARGARRARAGLAVLELGFPESKSPAWLMQIERSVASSTRDQAPAADLGWQFQKAWNQELPAQIDRESSLAARARVSSIFPPALSVQSLDETASTPDVLLRRERAKETWIRAADYYRYVARDWANLRLPWPADSSPERFFAEAAATYQAVGVPTLENYLQIQDNRGGAKSDVVLLFRAFGPIVPKRPTPLPVRMILPDTSSFRVTPASAKVEMQPGSSEASLPIRIQTQPVGERTKALRGFLVQAGYLGRHYHHKIEVTSDGVAEQVQFFVSTNPKRPDPPLQDVRLRAGKIRQAYYLFARNLTDQTKNVLLEIKDQNGSLKGGELKLTLAPGETRRVQLGQPPPTLPPVIPEFHGPLHLRALDVDKQNSLLGERVVSVGIAPPREYVRVESRSFAPAGPANGGKNKLSVTLEGVVPFAEPAIPVEMVLSPQRIPGFLGAKDGTLRGELPAKMTGPPPRLVLFAENLQLDPSADEEGYFYLNVDGYARAFVFRTTFARQGSETTPRPDGRPAIRVVTESYALADSKWNVLLEVDNAPPDASLEVSMGQFQGERFQADLVRKLPGPRDELIGCLPQGPDGALLFEAVLKDWVVPLNISGIQGARLIRVRLLDSGGGVMQTAVKPILSDSTPPERVRFVEPPTQAKKGSRLVLRATGGDPESGIARVVFFLGRPQGNKPPEKVASVEGTPVKGSEATWSAALPLPDVKGPAEVSAQFVNGVGLSRFDTTTIDLLDTDPRITGPGKIRGVVMEGPRPQPGLEVTLKDPKGNALAKAKTGPDGVFEIAPVAPGNYVVYAAKAESQRRGSRATKVEPNKTAEVTVELELP